MKTDFEMKSAMKFYRSQPGRRQMPMPADYLQAIPDGHPTAQEAWAMMPKDEYTSVVWSEEMREAYGKVRSLMTEHGNSDFFSFKEIYEKKVQAARARRQKPKWSLSAGFDKSGRDAAMVEAIDNGRLTLVEAVKLHPELASSPIYQPLAIAYEHSKITRDLIITTLEKLPSLK